jgi:hypothetical protein
MRLEGQRRGGFYPCPPEVLVRVGRRVKAAGAFNVLDPCAGKGEAVATIAQLLGGTPYAIELEEGRAAELAARLGRNVLAPASVFGCQCASGQFQMLWLNPPYDDELGGGRREELNFLMHTIHWLAPGGLLAFVIPEKIIGPYSAVLKYLYLRFDDLGCVPFPDDVRKYGECIVFGYKRKWLADKADWDNPPPVPALRAKDWAYYLDKADGPVRGFKKAMLTDDEVSRALAASPLQKLLQPPTDLPLGRPPLPLSKGHRAMLLAAGHLDGVIRPAGEPPHVIRGTCRKEQYVKEHSEEERSDGTVSKTVISERFILTIRALTPDGTIVELE